MSGKNEKQAIKEFNQRTGKLPQIKKENVMSKSDKALETLDRYIRARYPIIGVTSHEENWVMKRIEAVAKTRNRVIVTWSMTQGLKQEKPMDAGADWSPTYVFDDGTQAEYYALDTVLNFKAKTKVTGETDKVLFVIKDLHGLLGSSNRGFDPKLVRYLREIAFKFETTMHSMILLSPTLPVPPDLEKTIVLLEWPLPDTDELNGILSVCETDLPSRIPVKLNGDRERLIQSMMGLTSFEAGSVLMASIAATGELSEDCIPFIVKEKAQIIKKSGVLEYFDTSVTMSQVGGLVNLKKYASRKKMAFTTEAKNAGLDAPKGVLLVGVPGTGKSLSAKAIAGGTMPLLRMDIGNLMGGIVGESESNVRQALKVAEAVAPCVLWIDEVEKAIGGVESSNQSDGGTLARVFGTMLTWMQETTAPVYVVATANDARSLKPEFLRRFDNVMWVDLPNCNARQEILKVHLEKRGYSLESLGDDDIQTIVNLTWGFSGAEIEKAVKTAIETAFFNGEELTGKYIVAGAREIIPVSVTMAEQIETLRSWANDRALQADEPLEPRPEQVSSAPSRMADL